MCSSTDQTSRATRSPSRLCHSGRLTTVSMDDVELSFYLVRAAYHLTVTRSSTKHCFRMLGPRGSVFSLSCRSTTSRGGKSPAVLDPFQRRRSARAYSFHQLGCSSPIHANSFHLFVTKLQRAFPCITETLILSAMTDVDTTMSMTVSTHHHQESLAFNSKPTTNGRDTLPSTALKILADVAALSQPLEAEVCMPDWGCAVWYW